MKPVLFLLACAVPISVVLLTGQQNKTAAAPSGEAAKHRATIDRYCGGCHGAQLKTANLELQKLDLNKLSDHAPVAETVIRKLRAGLMPPPGMPRPSDAEMNSLITWMEGELDRTAARHVPPPGIHRLNRAEYTNAIRDVLALEVDAAKFLPSDDSTRGFDNIAGALTVSPALLEAYLSAAGKIARLAIGNVNAPTQAVFDAPADTAQNYHIEGLPFGTRGGMLIRHTFPVDGDYTFKVKGVTGYFQAVLGSQKGEQLIVTVDGELAHKFDWDREIANTTGNGRATPKIHVKAGLHTIGVTFVASNDIPGVEMDRPFLRTMNTPGTIPGFSFYPHVGQVWIEGPYDGKGAADTASRRKIFTCTPKSAAEEAPCAREIISTLVKHAFRRPATQQDVNSLLEFYQAGRVDNGSFDDGIEAALQRVIADPEFVFRLEAEPATVSDGGAYRIDDMALASRLSFFLWSSVPDDQLIDLAAANKLHEPAVLEQQVRRMLADPKFESLVTNFTGQWLSVRSLKTIEPAVNLFPDFDDNLRAALQREVELFFDSIAKEDRSIVDLLTADYTFVNERLAEHYGIPNVYGPQFRRVELPAEFEMRRGLLGKGALMAVTSAAIRTSPVARGKWYLQTFLGVSPPDPPPDVPAIKETNVSITGNTKIPTMRETMAIHRANRVCAACHEIFEPMGIALENFDAVGAWRTLDAGQPIDASGKLPDGTAVDGVNTLRASLVKRSDQFARVVTEKMLTYALGRGTEYQDMPTVRSIVRAAAPGKYKFSDIVLGVVRSDAFQMNTKVAGETQRAGR